MVCEVLSRGISFPAVMACGIGHPPGRVKFSGLRMERRAEGYFVVISPGGVPITAIGSFSLTSEVLGRLGSLCSG